MKISAALVESVGEPFKIEEIDLDEPRSDEIIVREKEGHPIFLYLHRIEPNVTYIPLSMSRGKLTGAT